MKTGLTLSALAEELDRQKAAKRDFISPTPMLVMEVESDQAMRLVIKDMGTFGVNDIAHGQIADRIGIPQKYYEKMRVQAPDLLARNVNHWFEAAPEKRMVRTLDGNARAFLSDRYRPLDHFDLATPAIDVLAALKCEVKSCQLTEKRMYLKATCATITGEIAKGDMVEAGVMISNSEVGHGSLSVEPFINRLVCTNGLVVNQLSMRKYHVGRGFGGNDGEQASEFFSDQTRRADDRAFFLKVRDIIRGTFNQDLFAGVVERMRAATKNYIEGDLNKVVEVVQDRYSLNDGERDGVLKHLIKGGDLSQWGLLNAITRTATDQPDYDRATELERLGGQVLELPKSEWDRLTNSKQN